MRQAAAATRVIFSIKGPAADQTIRPGGLGRAPRAWTRPPRVAAYGLGMPASKRPAPQDARIASRILLDGLARGADIFGIVSELAPLHPRNNTFPGEVFLRVGADALDWHGASRADPVSLEGIRERFLSECAFDGRENRKFRIVVLAAAALCGGAEPDLLDEVAWWQTDDFWQYALFAAIAYIRIAAERASVPVHQVSLELTERPDARPG
jgi:hypothetical protein